MLPVGTRAGWCEGVRLCVHLPFGLLVPVFLHLHPQRGNSLAFSFSFFREEITGNLGGNLGTLSPSSFLCSLFLLITGARNLRALVGNFPRRERWSIPSSAMPVISGEKWFFLFGPWALPCCINPTLWAIHPEGCCKENLFRREARLIGVSSFWESQPPRVKSASLTFWEAAGGVLNLQVHKTETVEEAVQHI